MSPDGSVPDRRPVDPLTGDPIGPLAQPGYYPGYSTLSQQAFWDAHTREVVLRRVTEVPPIRFFTPEEARLMAEICDHIIPQDDRTPERRIPILPRIDHRLFEDKGEGYRYEDMPPDPEAYRLALRAIDEMARKAHGRGFLEIGPLEQDRILESIHHGKPRGARRIWKRMRAHRFWFLLVRDCVEAYYSHPWAWDEIGYGGPAYPRAYTRLEHGEPEPWECEEQRYEWKAPPASISDTYEFVGGQEEHLGAPGGGGTH